MKTKVILIVIFIVLTKALEINNIPEVDIIKDEKSSDIQTRIIGGRLARSKQFPYQVGLEITIVEDEFESWCGGSLIARNFVLTATHCVYQKQRYKLVNGSYDINPNVYEIVPKINVYLGLLNKLDRNEKGHQIFQLTNKNVIIHDSYVPKKHLNDIALLKLPTEVEINEYVQLINLPRRSQNQENLIWNTVLISGWGIYNGFEISTDLRYVRLLVIPFEDCDHKFWKFIDYSKHICVNAERKGGCQGDSGGPTVITESDGTLTLIGVTSFVSKVGCGVGFPTGLTRVHSYLDWIHKYTGIPIRN